MTREEFDRLVKEAEAGAAQDDRALRWRILRLAIIGYVGLIGALSAVFIFGLSLIFVGCFLTPPNSGILFSLGGLVLLAGVWNAMGVFWIRLKPPEGIALHRDDAPALYAILDELQRALKAAPFRKVVVSDACNASVYELPRLGVLGWPSHHLVLGLPLLETISAEELRAVLAHEFAHLSKRHGRAGTWIYRLRRSWEQIFRRLNEAPSQQRALTRVLLIRFVDWFWPRFNANAFVLSRAQEFEADSVATHLAGAHHAANALLRIELNSRLLGERFWPELWRTANEDANLPSDVFLRLRDALRAGVPTATAAQWMEEAFLAVNSNQDTHPCLAARWTAMGRNRQRPASGVSTSWMGAVEPSAAETLLSPMLNRIRLDLERRWRKDAEKPWRDMHAKAQSLKARLETIDLARDRVETDLEIAWDKALTIIDLQGDLAAEPVLRQVLALRPSHPGANFYLGRHLLSLADDQAVLHFTRAMEEDESLTLPASEALLGYYRRVGNTDKIREIEARLDTHETASRTAEQRGMILSRADTFLPHLLTDEQLDSLCGVLCRHLDLVSADLVRKELPPSMRRQLFVLSLHTRRRFLRGPDADEITAIANRLLTTVKLPGRVLIIGPAGTYRAVARKIAALDNVEVYRRV